MKEFQFYSPKTKEEALTLLGRFQDKATVVAGGTDIVIELNERKHETDCVVNINKLKELKYCTHEDGKVKIGALTTFADLEKNEYIQNHVKSLANCASQVGSPQIRNLGTVGGNVCNASVAGDSHTTFMALDATVVLESRRGRREMKLTDFYADCPKTQIAADELLTEIYFTAPNQNVATAAYKLGKRKALVIVVIGLSVLIEREGDKIKRAQAAIGAVSKKPSRLPQLENYLAGKPLTQETFAPCADMLSATVQEMIPTRASVTYKKESVKGVADKVFNQILADFGRR